MKLTYKIIPNGYEIYNNGALWLSQGEASNGYFPYPVLNNYGKLDLEASAKAHIDAIVNEGKANDEVTKLNQKVTMLEGCIMELAQVIDDLYGGDGNEE